MRPLLFSCILSLLSAPSPAQTPYKLPPPEVVDILDAPPTPLVSVSPARDAMAYIEYRANPPIELLARPILRVAGLRIAPGISARQRITQYTGITIQRLDTKRETRIALPAHARIGTPSWSHDGKSLAFTRDVENGVELWVADPATGDARAVTGLYVNDVLGSPFSWMSDNATLLVRAIRQPPGPPPPPPLRPVGPNVEETYGKVAKVATYQDLLKNPHDEALFEFYATSQLLLVNTRTREISRLGSPGIYPDADFSPDEKYLLVTRIKKPFSYRVPYRLFTRSIEIWDRNGNIVTTVAEHPVSDDIPTQGVEAGPRDPEWQPVRAATLVWAEALDGGDPTTKVPFRDKLMLLPAPFAGPANEVFRTQHRFSGFSWMPVQDEAFVAEYDRDRRWTTTSFLSLANPSASRRVVFDLSMNDAYNNPGSPVYQTRPSGETTVLRDGEWIYLSGRGASEKGDMPFLDRMNVRTLEKQRLFRSDDKSVEQFVSFVGTSRTTIITRFESRTQPPNYFTRELGMAARSPLTAFTDPAPRMTGMKKELITYSRADGVSLSGTLYLPPDYTPGTRLPCLIWAYPLEFSDPGTAGQVRGSANSFTFFRGATPLFFVTQGYAVLMDATMPVVGDPETVNNTFVEQIVGSARAAIDRLDSTGIIDRKRVAVSGHSYGAFMTANLLAHCDLFAAGIARSGAYNRTLTPFGFQSERRSFWEASETYMKMSPFTYANRIKAPLLLIHGEADNNTGTFPIQSERFFQALKGTGGTAKLVLLPFESHGYSARESVLHVLAESFEWADRYVKNRK